MASPHEKLAESLKALRALQDRGVVAVRSGDLTRSHQERLVKNGFLQEVILPIRGHHTVFITLSLACKLLAQSGFYIKLIWCPRIYGRAMLGFIIGYRKML